jgi:hypothetical protein
LIESLYEVVTSQFGGYMFRSDLIQGVTKTAMWMDEKHGHASTLQGGSKLLLPDGAIYQGSSSQYFVLAQH